jgi:hypothetical protein
LRICDARSKKKNQAIMKCVAAYLFAQYWPDDTGWVQGTKTGAGVGQTARARLMAVMKSLYDKGYEENLSHNYAPVHLFPYFALYDCATDPGIKAAANAAVHFHVANLVANHFEGVTIPPANRDNPRTTSNTYTVEPGKRHAGGPDRGGLAGRVAIVRQSVAAVMQRSNTNNR